MEDVPQIEFSERIAAQYIRLLLTTLSLPTRHDQLRHLIRRIQHLPPSRNLARRAAVARRHVQRRVLGEEVPRPQEQRHGLCGHDGEVFWGWEVRDAEGVPEHDVGVVDGGVFVGDPLGDAAGGLAGGLWDVPAGRVDLLVVVCGFVSWEHGRDGRESLHLVTWTACLAKPARFHTSDPSLGRSFGTSLLTSL